MEPGEDLTQASKDSKEPFEFLADQVPDFLWMTGPEGIETTYSNKPFLDYLGLSSVEEFLGITWEQYMHPDDVAAVVRVYGDAYRKKVPYNLEARLRQASTGLYQWFLIHGMPRYDRTGQFAGFIGTAVDISVFKRMQNALDQQPLTNDADLLHRITRLEQSNEDLLTFARVTSHDLRQPLRKVKLYLGMFLAQMEKGITKDALLYLGKAQSAADRMSVMIDGILRYSLLDGESGTETIPLNRLIEQITLDLEVLVREKQGIVEATALPEVVASPVMMYQLFYNLIYNALKFSRQEHPPIVRITGKIVFRDDGWQVRISIRDNGIGFPRADKERIFDEFTRLNGDHPGEGLGIGLALCKKIVQRHRGTIKAKSHATGAEFVVCLPLTAPPFQSAARSTEGKK